MVKGFFIPQTIAFPAQDLIHGASGNSFQSMCDPSQRNIWFDQNVNVIRHDNVGVKFIEIPIAFTASNCFDDDVGYARTLQPKRATQWPCPVLRPSHETAFL